MKFKIEIKLGNEAMQDGEHIARALMSLADILVHYDAGGLTPGLSSWIYDLNGHKVGRWRISR